MAKKLFVGNLDWNTSQEDLQAAFAAHGEVEEAIIIRDQAGRSKGFGFVTYVNEADADNAVAAMNGAELGKRKIAVSEARPPKPREDRGYNRY